LQDNPTFSQEISVREDWLAERGGFQPRSRSAP